MEKSQKDYILKLDKEMKKRMIRKFKNNFIKKTERYKGLIFNF